MGVLIAACPSRATSTTTIGRTRNALRGPLGDLLDVRRPLPPSTSMRLLQTTGRLAALAVLLPLALAGCDAAGPDPATADARPDAGFTTVRMSGDGPAVRGRQDKVAVCHSDDDGTFRLIEVGAPALPAHIRHGDGAPGGAVPGRPGFVFDEACAPVPAALFTCTTEAGVDAEGRNTLIVTVLVTDPAALPLNGLDAPASNVSVLDLENTRATATATATQFDPTRPSTLTVRAHGVGASEFTCGPYEFGVPAV